MQPHNESDAPRQQREDKGRSREREQQDEVIERAAREESWLSRLLRSYRERKGRPRSGTHDRG
jgi:hypothetical protein